ncbi:uncharacterized protein LOC114373281 [Glycine soja]|uniref:uncharacterized protein n=1 Tax=Glycine max TaxID=3847 RepID=UPI0003DED420|nr:uncharacterized protein LOC100803848 [Glycine max]XP_028186582.1 uncharacterized protein LOC114373281 [Glycine soja]|eukprot:XP_006595387.1 uncharacterized protein LOC100803848 [Glycine max]
MDFDMSVEKEEDGMADDTEDASLHGVMSDGQEEEANAKTEFPINANATLNKQQRFLSNEERRSVCRLLLNSVYNGKLKEGTTKNIATFYYVSRRVIQRIWRQLRETKETLHKKTKNCGRKRIGLDIERIREIPLSKQTTLRSLSHALEINKTSLIRFHKNGIIRRHSNAIKPFLKDENMKSRLRFCLSKPDNQTIPHNPMFKSMHNIVFIDEKWFYMTKNSMNYYLAVGEEEPHQTCRSKNFICKVMILCAMARPRFNSNSNETFDVKIGIFPFVTKEPIKRRCRDYGNKTNIFNK